MRKTFHISNLKPSAFQGRFDFDTVSKRQAHALAVEHPAERFAFMVLFAVVGVLLCGYFYFVTQSVFNVIAEKEADAHSSQIQTSIGDLEQQYFSLSQSLTPQTAADLGMSPIQNTAYVYRPGNEAAVPSSVHAI